MKKNNIIQKIKFVLLAVILGLGLNYVSATTNIWTGPSTTPPGANKVVVLNDTVSGQTKGGNGLPLPGSLFNIEGSLSGTNLAIWNDANVSGDFYVNSLNNPASGTPRLCVDASHKLNTSCGASAVCGNSIVEPPEQCDEGVNNGDGSCSLTCQLIITQCNDGIDNDSDSLIDYPQDPGCFATFDNSETNTGGGYGGGFSHCFVADTKVAMADGSSKNIQDVAIGDVLKGETTNNTVLGFHQPKLGNEKVYSFNGGRYFVTAEHPFATTGGWKSLNPDKTKEEHLNIVVTKLKLGDTLITNEGLVKLESIDGKVEDSNTQLYNFALDGDHTYYADGYLVHNKVACSADGTGGNPACGGGLFCVDSTPAPTGHLALTGSSNGICSIPCSTPEPDPQAYCTANPNQGGIYSSFCASYDLQMHYCPI